MFGSSGSNLLIASGTRMSENSATTGGAMYCDACQQMTMTTSALVESNHASTYGGGAYCNLCECVLFKGIIFANNT